MVYIPFLQRLNVSQWPILLFSLSLIYFELIVSFITSLIPNSIINSLTRVIDFFYKLNPISINNNIEDPKKLEFYSRLKNCSNFQQISNLFGYESEHHLIKTDDNYILTLHRILPKDHNQLNKKRPIIYFHHGLLMNSEVFITMFEKNHNLPFLLIDLGYDVWLGNNRGNKYSKKHLNLNINSNKFWDFSIDEFALFDIPNSINYILHLTKIKKLTYIGFSQGTAQGFASLSINNSDLNNKINCMIALSPAMTPPGITNSIVDTLMKSSPILMFLIFGKKILLSSTTFWNSIIYPQLFIKILDYSMIFLFNWSGSNINSYQKLLSYSHLYSSTSVKVVVHWFQIMRNKTFQMYNDDTNFNGTSNNDYKISQYPTKNIKVPILLIYGKKDSLIQDINIILNQLPDDVKAIGIDNYEHLEIIWGNNIENLVFKPVLNFLKIHNNNSLINDNEYSNDLLKNIKHESLFNELRDEEFNDENLKIEVKNNEIIIDTENNINGSSPKKVKKKLIKKISKKNSNGV